MEFLLFMLGLMSGLLLGGILTCLVFRPALQPLIVPGAGGLTGDEPVMESRAETDIDIQLANMFRYDGTGRGQKGLG